MNDASELLIYTDLDGTLLDHYSCSFEPARPLIDFLNSESIPWILNTSKTLAELSELRIAFNDSQPGSGQPTTALGRQAAGHAQDLLLIIEG